MYRIHLITGKDSIDNISTTVNCLNRLANKVYLLFILQIRQLMEDGPIGLSGLHAMPPVAQELVKEAESATTHHRTMMGRTVSVKAMNLRSAIRE